MKSLKKLPLVLSAVGLGAVSSFAEIKLTDNLSMTGFLDMSVSGKDTSDASLNMSFDQLELDFLYKYGNLSARADVNAWVTEPGMAPKNTVNLEQAFVSYAFGPLAVTGGRFLSSSGFEAAEPTGMYQYSYSKTLVYGAYQNGVSVGYTTPLFGLYGAVVSDLWDGLESELLNSPGFEGQVSVTPIGGLTAKVAYLHQIYDDKPVAPTIAADDGQQLINAWASFAKGPLTVAAEYNQLFSWLVKDANGNPLASDESGMGWLAMANYKITDNYAATVRYSGIVFPDLGEGDPDTEVTFSPSVALTPNWLALAEVKYEIDAEITNYAVESTFSF